MGPDTAAVPTRKANYCRAQSRATASDSPSAAGHNAATISAKIRDALIILCSHTAVSREKRSFPTGEARITPDGGASLCDGSDPCKERSLGTVEQLSARSIYYSHAHSAAAGIALLRGASEASPAGIQAME